ncbi:MAG: flagellar hook-associated protein FlgK [Planctomycetes bacterium]|nr:flagellar hook-associated protein FlgK [Planctomycetota bacterium]
MSLTSALHIGRSAITVSQIGLQVTGNNMANATTPGYTRNTVSLNPMTGERVGMNAFVGRGVELDDVIRHVDEALRQRIRSALSEEESTLSRQRTLSQIETLHNELTKQDLSTALGSFFSSWSELANNPDDSAIRSLVVQEGISLSEHLRDLRHQYVELRNQIDSEIDLISSRANSILEQVAGLNGSIVDAEQGNATASSLRDQRDRLLSELAEIMDITVIEQVSGTTDVLVNSIPVLLGNESRGVQLRTETIDGELVATVRVRADGSRLTITEGQLGALLNSRDELVSGLLDDVDTFAGQLIFQVNKVHSQGQGSKGFDTVTGTYGVTDADAALNATDAGLPFTIKNGSLQLNITNEATGARTTTRIDIDLDGVGSDMTLNDLATAITAVDNATATVNADGTLTLTATDGYRLSFSDDTADALAALGLNSYFDGFDASNITVNDTVQTDTDYLAVGADHVPGSNDTALAIAELETQSITELGSRSLREFWSDSVEEIAVQLDATNVKAATTSAVREGLQAQEAAVSGVSLDEESINLMNFQRQYEAAARFISVVNDLMDQLLAIV